MATGSIQENSYKATIDRQEGQISDAVFSGTISLDNEQFPRLYQFSISNVTSSTVDVNFEFDRIGTLTWAVFNYPVSSPVTKGDILNGTNGAVDFGDLTVNADEFTTFTIQRLYPETKYELYYYTEASGYSSPPGKKQFIMSQGSVVFGDSIFELQFEDQFE